MVKQSTRGDEVIGAFFHLVLQDIDAAHFQIGPFQAGHETEIDVARDDVASGPHKLSQNSRDGPVAAPKLQAAPAGTHAQAVDGNPLDRIEERGHERQALLLACQVVRQTVCTHRWRLSSPLHSLRGVQPKIAFRRARLSGGQRFLDW